MAKRSSVHTVPKSSGSGWVNKVGGRTVSSHHRKDTAIKSGRDTARKNQSEHVIHNKDGKISQSNSHGGDPNPPKDKR